MLERVSAYGKYCSIVLAIAIMGTTPAYAVERPAPAPTLADVQQTEKGVPVKQKPPQVEVDQPVKSPLAADPGLQIAVTGFRLTGQLPVQEQDLLALIADGAGKDLSLTCLEELAARITKYLQKQGYIVARAYLPAQEIKDGIVEIAVVIGRYDEIIFRNKADITDRSAQLEMGGVKSGAYIEKKALERALWLIGDLAGAEAKATLAPGSKAGTSNLIVNVLPKGKPISGNISIDTYGNHYTGREQATLNTNILNLARRGDTLLVNGITTGDGLSSGGIAYRMPALAPGGKLEVGYTKMHYSLSDPFADFTGVADTGSVTYTQNFLRSRKANLYGQLGFNAKDLYDDGPAGNYKHNKSQSWIFAVNGDVLDDWGGGGVNAYSLAYTAGRLDLRNGDDWDNDRNTANSNGSFSKWNAFFVRQQYINERLSMMLSVIGQVADKNLDSSEKISLGGPYGVRAYPKGEASGDEGYQATAEMRWTIPIENKTSVFQIAGFLDTGSVTINKNPWTTVNNRRTLHGAGLGLLWNEPGDYSFRVHYAWKLGNEAATSDTDRSGRLWLQFTKYF